MLDDVAISRFSQKRMAEIARVFNMLIIITFRIENPDTLRASRVGAANGGAAREGGAL